MKQILYIRCCARQQSRTARLADAVVETLEGEVTVLDLYREDMRPLDEESLNKRDELIGNEQWDDPVFGYARQVADADIIVIAAPYWDLSFPSLLKVFIEQTTVAGITFNYSDEGYPVGYCRAEKLIYVTTSGGTIGRYDFGFEYVETIFRDMYGIKETESVRLEDLDIVGNDPEEMLNKAIEKVRRKYGR